MSLDGYTVTCQRGHDRATFTGRAALDHVQACHGRKPGTVWTVTGFDRWGGSKADWRIWKPCDRVVKARPWKAPKAPAEVPAAFLAKLSEYPFSLPRETPWAFVTVTHEYVTDADERAA